jgi:signal transduction histidine kinase
MRLGDFSTNLISEDITLERRTKIILTNKIALLLALAASPYFILFYFTGHKELSALVIPLEMALLLTLFFNFKGFFQLSRWTLLLSALSAILFYSCKFGKASGIQSLYFAFTIVPLVIFEKNQKYQKAFALCLPIVFLITQELSKYTIFSYVPTNPFYTNLIFFVVTCTTFIISILSITLLIQTKEKAEDEKKLLITELQEKNRSLELAIQVAQELSVQAKFASLSSGIAHEIRNPITAMQGYMYFLMDRLTKKSVGGAFDDDEFSEEKTEHVPWVYRASRQDFLDCVGQDGVLCDQLIEELKSLEFLTDDFALNPGIDPDHYDPSVLAISPVFNTDSVRNFLEKFIGYCVMYRYLNMTQVQYGRILGITDSMLKYGKSGGGVKRDSFEKISGFNEKMSGEVYDHLIATRFLDSKGCVIPGADGVLPELSLPEEYEHYEPHVKKLIFTTAGAIKKSIHVVPILKGTVEMLKGMARKTKIALTLEESDTIPAIWGDDLRLQQAFFNVIYNAIQALDSRKDIAGKAITVRTLLTEFQGHEGGIVPGIEIQIEDNGPGIPDEIKQKIFDPFFSTKSKSGGVNAGLGLSILKDVILYHGGAIEIDSVVGKGTTFRIFVPIMG